MGLLEVIARTNKSNNQINVALPRKKLPKDILDAINKQQKIKINIRR